MTINGTARGTCRHVRARQRVTGQAEGYVIGMADDDREDISEVMIPSEEVHPDHREHAKTPKHLDDDELAQRTEYERNIVGGDKRPPDV
jgi:hypothetical protein